MKFVTKMFGERKYLLIKKMYKDWPGRDFLKKKNRFEEVNVCFKFRFIKKRKEIGWKAKIEKTLDPQLGAI